MQIKRISVGTTEDFLSEKLPTEREGCVTALGFFDGMHKAHTALIGEARSTAKKMGLSLVVFTFSSDSGIKSSSKRLLTDEERLSRIELSGADVAIVCDFSEIKDLSHEAFVEKILIEKLNTKVAVCGFNFRFGKGAVGDAAYLRSAMEKAGREAIIFEEMTLSGTPISASAVREALLAKNVPDANKLLGYPYFITGTVTHGLGMGKGLGIPTVNTDLPENKLSLPSGVYFTAVVNGGKIHPALTNVGTCPTFGRRGMHAETFILNFEGDLYEQTVRIYFIEFLREEKTFSGAEELIMQINVDKERAFKLAKETKWQEIGLSLQ